MNFQTGSVKKKSLQKHPETSLHYGPKYFLLRDCHYLVENSDAESLLRVFVSSRDPGVSRDPGANLTYHLCQWNDYACAVM